MASSPPTLSSEEDNSSTTTTPIFRPSVGRRTSSFSSSSSSSFGSSYIEIEDFPPLSPKTPLTNYKGVPFSWEQLPGIPKQKDFKNKRNSGQLLPLPPAGNTISPRKNHSSRFSRDPFFVALVECSKDDSRIERAHFGSKVTRSLSDRFGFISLYTSCKTTCAVSESLVYLPARSRRIDDR